MKIEKKGDPFGAHRVLEPKGALPQSAVKISNEINIYSNEILVDVEILNVDSASFRQIKEKAGGDKNKIGKIILGIVEKSGKLKNPVTGSGGMFIGVVSEIGSELSSKIDLKPGDRIASLVSLSLTPLKINKILDINKEIDQVKIEGKAVLFETGIYSKLPDDISPTLALAVLDVCGAPAQVERLVKEDDTVAIVGAGGKSGILCAYMARKKTGKNGKVLAFVHSKRKIPILEELALCDEIVCLEATDPLECYEKMALLTNNKLADVVINTVNTPDTEMGSILMTKERGTLYFFSMATSFARAALGAEGVGKDIDMIIGNGYARDHAQLALNILRENKKIRELYGKTY